MPNAVIEAMSCALPCLISASSGAVGLIRDGANGLLVTTAGEWLGALRRLLDDADLRRRLGEQARRDAVANYSVKAVARDYRQVLASVMEEEKDGRR